MVDFGCGRVRSPNQVMVFWTGVRDFHLNQTCHCWIGKHLSFSFGACDRCRHPQSIQTNHWDLVVVRIDFVGLFWTQAIWLAVSNATKRGRSIWYLTDFAWVKRRSLPLCENSCCYLAVDQINYFDHGCGWALAIRLASVFSDVKEKPV